MTQATTLSHDTSYPIREVSTLHPTITVTPATKRSVQNTTRLKHQTNVRVAAYCRVSTGDECQQTSYNRQMRFYSSLIREHPGWAFAGIYADADASGTNTGRRVNFQRMIADCQTGKIDYIITKSISRFARNTVDTLNHVRMLKQLNPSVGIFFEKENVDTLDATGELLLTILSALAQDESRSISDNVRWAYSKKFQAGIAHCNLKGMMGYDKGENGQWIINEAQASIVRLIYDMYLSGDSACKIARELNARAIPTLFGKRWDASAIMRMLRNEKYMGDCELQKTIVKDFLTHHSDKNRGEAPRYYVRNHHSPIISREKWNKVQLMIADLGGTRRHTEPNNANQTGHSTLTSPKTASKKRSVPIKGQTFYNLRCGEVSHRQGCENPDNKNYYDNPDNKNCCGSPNNKSCCDGPDDDRQKDTPICGGTFHRSVYNRPIPNYFDERSIRSKTKHTGTDLNNEFYEIYKYTFAVWRCSNRFGTKQGNKIIRTGKETCTAPILYEIALEQSYMEMLYRLKKDYKADNKHCELIQSYHTALSGTDNCNHEELQTNLELFLSFLLKLPEKNDAGMDIIVSMPDSDIAPSLSYQSSSSPCPDLLPFKRGLYTAFVDSATVYGDEIEYKMNFGSLLKSYGNQRNLESFLGYRRCSNGIAKPITNVWEVSNSSIQYRRIKKK